MEPVEGAHHAGHGVLAELHPVLELQAELLLAAVVQHGQEGLGTVAEGRRGRRGFCSPGKGSEAQLE